MAEVPLTAEPREGRGKGPARRLRAAGKVPGTLYGRGIEAVSLEVDARELTHTLSTDAGTNVLIDLHIDGDTHLAMARQLDRDPIRGVIRHIDFLKIARDQTVTVDVPIHFEGDAIGVKEQGGVVEHHLWALHVECLPRDVPDSIVVDVSNMAVGDSLHVSDIEAPAGVTVLSAPEEIIASCAVPQAPKLEAEVAEEPAEGEVAATGQPAEGEGGEGGDQAPQ